MLRDVEAMLDLADEHTAEIEAMYQDTLAAQEIPGRLQALIQSVIGGNRAALDFVAVSVDNKYGTPTSKDKVYWPYSTDPAKFDERFDKNLPKVRLTAPVTLIDTWRRFQPYEPGYEWLGHLFVLAKDNKHRVLTAQTKSVNVRLEDSGIGGTVSWDPSGVTFGPGVLINDRPVDPITQRTSETKSVVYVDWRFTEPNVSALATLKAIQKGMRPMLQEVCRLSGL